MAIHFKVIIQVNFEAVVFLELTTQQAMIKQIFKQFYKLLKVILLGALLVKGKDMTYSLHTWDILKITH